METQNTYHEVGDIELTGFDASPSKGGELGWNLPASVVTQMVGKTLHVHEDTSKPSHCAFTMEAHPHDDQTIVLKPIDIHGLTCQTWLYQSDSKDAYIGVSNYQNAELAQLVAGLGWAEGYSAHVKWFAQLRKAA
jgi:hypothetical protein